MELNLTPISKLEPFSALLRYIYELQGFELRRLNYVKAAKALSCSRRTISRHVTKLADVGAILFIEDKLQLNEQILKR